MSVAVTIVIPTYRRLGLLFRCLSALSRQDFEVDRMEVVVVTDGPDAATEFLMEGAMDGGPVFRRYSLPEKKGPAAARNLGWQRARGELILFTDDDCVPGKDWVSSYWETYMEYKRTNRLGWVFGDQVAFKGSVVVPRPPEPTDYEKNVAWLERAEFVTANCACPVDVLRRTGGFDESFTMAWREDSDLQFRLLEEGIPVIEVPGAQVVHPVRKAYWGISLKEQKKSLFNALLYKKHPALFRKKIYRWPFWNYYTMIGLLLTALVALLSWDVPLAIMAATAWLIMTLDFARKRLKGTSHALGHVAEMVVTSMAIPFLSVFWTIYGAIRYKTFFL